MKTILSTLNSKLLYTSPKGVHATLYTIALLAVLIGCQPKDIVFDHEQPQFEIKANAILLEVIVPAGTAADDQIYMVGPYNGTDSTNLGSMILTKAEKTDYKFGIYVFPSDIAEGKSLADGFYFVSKKQNVERFQTMHTIANAQLGQRYDLTITAWQGNPEKPKIEHDGHVIYVLNHTDWTDLALYAWGDGLEELFGGWPGVQPTGTETIQEVEYLYFDCGEANEGLTYNLIFNNNGGGSQLADFNFTISRDIYLEITNDGVKEIEVGPIVEHDGAVVYILDGIGWGLETTLYMWGDVNDLNGGWPGMSNPGTQKFGDYTYMYFDCGAANAGLAENLIFSKNGVSQIPDYAYTIGEPGEKIYLYMTSAGCTVIEDPANPGEVEWFDPVPVVKDPAIIDLYIYDATETFLVTEDTVTHEPALLDLSLYAWGTTEIFGAWPGSNTAQWEEVTILGLKLKHIQLEGFVGDSYNVIVNNKAPKTNLKPGENQYDAFGITVSEPYQELYYKLTDTEATPLQVTPLAPSKL